MKRKITTINLAITDRCNRSCPNCCCGVPDIIEHWDISDKELFHAVDIFYGIERVKITGGEPTIHPKFIEWAPNFKKMFGCSELAIETNGYLSSRPDILRSFDEVCVTQYTDNQDDVNALREFKLIPPNKPIEHVNRSVVGDGYMCDRGWSREISVYKNWVYPCCIGWGVQSDCIHVARGCLEDILDVKLPCNKCFFSVSKVWHDEHNPLIGR